MTKTEMVDDDRFRNLLALLFIIFNEGCNELADKAPNYIMDKYCHFMGGPPPRKDKSWMWGLHPNLRVMFDAYLERWGGDTNYEHS